LLFLLQVCSIIIPVQVEVLKVKVSQQFTFSGAVGCAVPSLSHVQVELLSKVSQQFTCYSVGLAVPSLSQLQVESLKVKVSQQFAFSGAAGCGSIIIPSTG
jgi:uncharacterized membrane protein